MMKPPMPKKPAAPKGKAPAKKGKMPPWLAGKAEGKGSGKTPFMKKGGKVCK